MAAKLGSTAWLGIKCILHVIVLDKTGNFVKHADFELAFDKEEKRGGAC